MGPPHHAIPQQHVVQEILIQVILYAQIIRSAILQQHVVLEILRLQIPTVLPTHNAILQLNAVLEILIQAILFAQIINVIQQMNAALEKLIQTILYVQAILFVRIKPVYKLHEYDKVINVALQIPMPAKSMPAKSSTGYQNAKSILRVNTLASSPVLQIV